MDKNNQCHQKMQLAFGCMPATTSIKVTLFINQFHIEVRIDTKEISYHAD